MKKILFLANIQYGEEPTGGGVQTRNQFMLNWLRRQYDVKFFDTWMKKPFISLLSSLYLVIIHRNRLIIISYGSRGALALMKILYLFRVRRKIKLFVPGNDYADIQNALNAKYWQCFDEIFVQSKFIKSELVKFGYTNISYCPNFKTINYRPTHKVYNPKTPLRFVYVGRLIEEKGIQVMIDACKLLKENFLLTIYGKETPKYNKDYFDRLDDIRIDYKGYINLKTNKGYDELATHDVLLFPTFFEGEGFSGTLIDALICGLPVIATDFNVNSEIVIDGVTGIIIPPKNVEALSNTMRSIINGAVDVKRMSENALGSVREYDIDTVLGTIFG